MFVMHVNVFNELGVLVV